MSERQYNLRKDSVDERDYKFSAAPTIRTKLPKKVDLRDKCPSTVWNQGSLGSCTANAGTTAEAMREGDASLALSRLYLYYMERSLEGTIEEDAGATMRSICKALNKYGVCEEKHMPYNVSKFKVAPSEMAHEDAAKHKISAYRSLQSVNQIKQCIALRQQPVLIGMEVYEQFENIGKDGKLQLPKKGEQSLGGHAVLVVGYQDVGTLKSFLCRKETGYFIVRNSWGTGWGDGGYFYMPYEYITTGHAWDFWTIE